MKGASIASRLALLPEPEAVARYFDHRNVAMLARVLFVGWQSALIATVVFAAQGLTWRAAAAGTTMVILGLLYRLRRTPTLRRRVRPLLGVVVFLLVVALFAVTYGEPVVFFALVAFVLPALTIFFRLRHAEYLAAAATLLGVGSAVLWLGDGAGDAGARIGLSVGAVATTVVSVLVASLLTARRRRAFLVEWRHEARRERERARMRSELSDARDIQLSMLPRAVPELTWLEVASVSLPASEVGGDYFDYLVLSPSRLAVVIGDVAGHGVAAGLVLSAVRAGLYLLHDELLHPVEVLNKLDPMIRETAPTRMFVTLQLAVLDRELGRLTVASAGHPPVVHLHASGLEASRVGGEAPPLGTRLDKIYREERVDLSRGDGLVFHTDGLTETRNHRGDLYGEARLLEDSARLAQGATARAVRENLLSSLTHFRGDVEQGDDVTLVVVRYLG